MSVACHCSYSLCLVYHFLIFSRLFIMHGKYSLPFSSIRYNRSHWIDNTKILNFLKHYIIFIMQIEKIQICCYACDSIPQEVRIHHHSTFKNYSLRYFYNTNETFFHLFMHT